MQTALPLAAVLLLFAAAAVAQNEVIADVYSATSDPFTTTASNPVSLALGDLDGDGDLDLLAAIQALPFAGLAWWENTGVVRVFVCCVPFSFHVLFTQRLFPLLAVRAVVRVHRQRRRRSRFKRH